MTAYIPEGDTGRWLMSMGRGFLIRRAAAVSGAAAALMLAVAVAGFTPRAQAVGATSPAATRLAPVPAGEARIWVYRELQPYESLATPYVRFNGAVIGVSQPGAVFYRDVPPGTYAVTVDSQGTDANQFTTVAVAAGQQVFVKVLSDAAWDSGGGGGDHGGGGGSWARPTFYTWQIQPQAAEAEIATMPLSNGG
jgi:hypothetical protein